MSLSITNSEQKIITQSNLKSRNSSNFFQRLVKKLPSSKNFIIALTIFSLISKAKAEKCTCSNEIVELKDIGISAICLFGVAISILLCVAIYTHKKINSLKERMELVANNERIPLLDN